MEKGDVRNSSLRIHNYELQSYILREVLKIEDVTVVGVLHRYSPSLTTG